MVLNTSLNLLELVIQDTFLPILFNQQGFTDLDKDIFSLPAKHGGLGIFSPVSMCEQEYSNSVTATKPIVSAIIHRKVLLTDEEMANCVSEIKSAKSGIRSAKTAKYNAQRTRIKDPKKVALPKKVDLLQYGYARHICCI